jgi:hypothetical protein
LRSSFSFRLSAILLIAVFVHRALLAQAQDDLDAASKQADANLNAVYQACLARFAPNSKGPLRVAQRAWIVFSDRDEAAASLLGKRRGLSDAVSCASAFCHSCRILVFADLSQTLLDTATNTGITADAQKTTKSS